MCCRSLAFALALLTASAVHATDPVGGLDDLPEASSTLDAQSLLMIGDAFSLESVALNVDFEVVDAVKTWSIYGSAKVKVGKAQNEADAGDGGDDVDAMDDDAGGGDMDDPADSDDDDDPCTDDDGDDKKVESDESGTLEIEADLGDADSPGLVVTGDGKVLQSLDIALSGAFELAGLTVCVDNDNPATIDYQADQDEYALSGALTVKRLWSATLALGTQDQPGIVIENGDFMLDGVTVDLDDVDVDSLKLKEFELAYSRGDDGSVDVDATLDIAFPVEGFEVDGEIDLVDGIPDTISLAFSATGDDEGIEIGDTGVSVVEIGATVSNLDQPADWQIDGTIGLDFGGQWMIDDQEVTALRMNGEVMIDRNMLEVDDMVFVGAEEDDDGNFTGLLGQGDVKLTLDWSEDRYELSGTMMSPTDPGVTVIADLLIDKGSYYFLGEAKLEVPESVPVVGGWVLEDIGVALQSVKGDADDSFGAGWTKVIFATVGAEYNFGTRAFKLIGGKTVGNIRQEVMQNEENAEKTTITNNFTVPEGATSLMIRITLTDPNVSAFELAADALAVTDQNGLLVLNEVTNSNGDLVTNSVSLVGGLLQELVVLGPSPLELTYHAAPLPGETLAGEGTFALTYLTALAPTLAMDIDVSGHFPDPTNAPPVTMAGAPPMQALKSQAQQDLVLTIARKATSPETLMLSYFTDPTLTEDARVSVFVDDDDEGYDGRLVARDLPYGDHDPVEGGAQMAMWGGETFSRKTDQPYYFYSVIDDGVNPRTASPYSEPVFRSPALSGRIDDPAREFAPVRSVRVYLDLNGNGQHDADLEPIAPTNSEGEYAFHDLDAGVYTVDVILPGHYRFDRLNSPNPRGVQVDASGTPQRVDFALNLLASLGGVVFEDENFNGEFDEGESPVSGLTMYLDSDGDGIREPGETRAITNRDGAYRFYDLTPGTAYFAVPDVTGTGFRVASFLPLTDFEQMNDGDVALFDDSVPPDQPMIVDDGGGGAVTPWSLLVLGGLALVASRRSRGQHKREDAGRGDA
ncbi:MAG: SdrD B-like domain-containing protein [Pseudomonadota bacterium]